MDNSLAITAYCQTCNLSHRAKDNEPRPPSDGTAESHDKKTGFPHGNLFSFLKERRGICRVEYCRQSGNNAAPLRSSSGAGLFL